MSSLQPGSFNVFGWLRAGATYTVDRTFHATRGSVYVVRRVVAQSQNLNTTNPTSTEELAEDNAETQRTDSEDSSMPGLEEQMDSADFPSAELSDSDSD